MSTSNLTTGAPPSGAHLAPPCDRGDCDGYRTYPTPTGPRDGHCGCPVGREVAEWDYAERHGKPLPIQSAQQPGGRS